MESGDLTKRAREIASQHPYVSVEAAPMPPPSENVLDDVVAYYALEEGSEDVKGVFSESQLEIMRQIALNLGAGLSPKGKQSWLLGRIKPNKIDESLTDALTASEEMKSSFAS